MNVRKPGMTVTRRHYRLLNYLFQNKIATFGQIHRDIFGPIKQPTVSQHLGKMMRERRITKTYVPYGDKFVFAYSLDEASTELLGEMDCEEMYRNQFKSGTPAHDIALVDVRSRLSKCANVISYHTENELRCLPQFRKDIRYAPYLDIWPDALLEVSVKGTTTLVPLELELSQKAECRYVEKLAKYYAWGEIRGVLFISGNAKIESAVRNAERKDLKSSKSKLFYVSYENTVKGNDHVHFSSQTGEHFVLA